VLEGNPVFRQNLTDGTYKEGRKSRGDNFHRQKAAIINIVKACFPFEIARHPNLECDDAIATLSILHAKRGDTCVIVSSDSDFIQLLNFADYEIQLYNPVKKKMIEGPNFDYVSWKALRGDPTDNIPGIPGVGDKTATKLINNHDRLREFLNDDKKRMIFERNVHLIRLVDFSSDMSTLERHVGKKDFDALEDIFKDLEFDSMLKEKTWKKYVDTFKGL
jgi:DNA polymerase-1